MNKKREIQRSLEQLFEEFLNKRLKDLTDLLPELFCREEPYYACVIDEITYQISFDEGKDLGVIPSTFMLDIGDVIISLNTSGGHSGGTLLKISITNPKDIEITLEDRDLILTKLKDNVTLRDFLRMAYTFTWKLERNHYLRIISATKGGNTIGDLMKNFLNIEAVPKRDITITIKKHYDILSTVRYEVGIIRAPLDVRINDTPENIALIDILDAFEFAFAPLFKKFD